MFVDFLVVGLSIGLVYGLVALGISLIYSGLDIVHFAHGEIFMFGAFFGLVLYNDAGISYPIWPSRGVSVSLGARMDGMPVNDVFGDSDGFRRPGRVIFVDPGLNWSFGKNTVSLAAPIAVDPWDRVVELVEEMHTLWRQHGRPARRRRCAKCWTSAILDRERRKATP